MHSMSNTVMHEETRGLNDQIERLGRENEALQAEIRVLENNSRNQNGPSTISVLGQDDDAPVKRNEMIRLVNTLREHILSLEETAGPRQREFALTEALAAKQAECTTLQERLAQASSRAESAEGKAAELAAERDAVAAKLGKLEQQAPTLESTTEPHLQATAETKQLAEAAETDAHMASTASVCKRLFLLYFV